MEPHVRDRVRILASVANPKSKADARSYDSRSTSDRITSPVAHQSAAELRKELDALNDLKSDLHSSDGVKRGKAIKRRQAIKAQLGAGA
jgi:hypothetical protein